MQPNDKVNQLLAAAREGSPEAIGEALEACRAYLLMVAQREMNPALRAKGGASDLVQETFLEAQRAFRHFDGANEADLLAWLRQVLLNNLADFSRRYRGTAKRDVGREVALEAGNSSAHWRDALLADVPTPSGHAIARETESSVGAALAQLPDEYRQVIYYRHQQGHSFEEIGKLMNRSADAARKLWSRAVERLERELSALK